LSEQVTDRTAFRTKTQKQKQYMKKQAQSMLGISAFLTVPESIEEFNTFLVGKPETALDYAISEAYYRGIAPKVRSKFLESVADKTGITPNVISTKKVGDKEVEVFERDTVYMKRVLGSGVPAGELIPLLQSAYDSVGWDLTSTRSSGPNAKDKEVAQFILNAIASGESTFERVAANYERLNPGLELAREDDGSISEDNLAEAARVDRVRRENDRVTSVL
jgi:hypothetical protein